MSIRLGENIISGSGGSNNDDISITKNTSNKIQTIGVINQNDTTNAVKCWMGTLAEYNILVQNDEINDNTLYNITDDINPEHQDIQLNNPFSLLDYKFSEYELNNASWLLSNGQFNSGVTYQSVYDLLLQELNGTSNKLPYRSYVNTIGNVVDTDGVLSGFAGGVYATIDEVPYSTADSIEILLKTTTGTLDTSNYKCFYSPVISNMRGVNLQVTPANKIMLYVSSNAGSSWDIVDGRVGITTLQSDTQYYFKYVYTGANHILYMSTTGAFAGEETTEVNVTNSGKPSNSAVSLGLQAWATTQSSYYWRGTIDLNESYININGERWWTGRRKIVTSSDNYANTDFVINTADTTFRLPIKVLLAGSKRVAGNGMTLGLTDGTDLSVMSHSSSGQWTTYPDLYGANVGTTHTGSTSTSQKAYGVTTDETKSGIETSSTGLYLYFYVGETVQDANIIAAASVLTRIAELSDSYISGLGMPSDRYEDLTLLVSGQSYTAPANGYFVIGGTTNTENNQHAYWFSKYGIRWTEVTTNLANNEIYCFCPCTKGESVIVDYGRIASHSYFRFYYAQGEENV